MDHQSVEKAIQIEPATQVTYSWHGNDLVIQPASGELAPNTQYHVTVAADAKTAPGVKIGQAAVVAVNTAPLPSPSPTPNPSPSPPAPPQITGEHTLSGTGGKVVGWSPDGKVVLFIDGEDLKSVNADGTGLKTIQAGVKLASVAPSGAALFAAANHRMHALRTVRIDEQLGPGAVPVASTYMVEAPNRMQVSVATGFQSGIIGTKDFSRKAATDPWQSTAITPLPLPYFIWDSASPLGVRIIGQATVDGVAAEVVAFFEDSSLGTVWFQVWVGRDGMIRQASMDAPGHFMDHHYSAFNKPVNIQRPA